MGAAYGSHLRHSGPINGEFSRRAKTLRRVLFAPNWARSRVFVLGARGVGAALPATAQTSRPVAPSALYMSHNRG
jgi:hypothetical protein